jgi:hypothetical protein
MNLTSWKPPDPSNFSPDGCTNFPDGSWEKVGKCCCFHDLGYFQAGSLPSRWESFLARRTEDYSLMYCVMRHSNDGIGLLMFAGVRLFGGFVWWRRYMNRKVKEKGYGLGK